MTRVRTSDLLPGSHTCWSIAKVTGLHRATIARALTGPRNPTLRTMLAIAKAAGCPAADIWPEVNPARTLPL